MTDLEEIIKRIERKTKEAGEAPEVEEPARPPGNPLFEAIHSSHVEVHPPFTAEEFERAKKLIISQIEGVTLMSDGSISSCSQIAKFCVVINTDGEWIRDTWKQSTEAKWQELVSHIESRLELSRVKSAHNSKVIATVAHEFQMPNI